MTEYLSGWDYENEKRDFETFLKEQEVSGGSWYVNWNDVKEKIKAEALLYNSQDDEDKSLEYVVVQDRTNSCTAWNTTRAVELGLDFMRQKRKEVTSVKRFSSIWLYATTQRLVGKRKSTGGATMSAVMTAINKYGVLDENLVKAAYPKAFNSTGVYIDGSLSWNTSNDWDSVYSKFAAESDKFQVVTTQAASFQDLLTCLKAGYSVSFGTDRKAAWNGSEYTLRGSTAHCLPGYTKVFTNEGVKTISDIVDRRLLFLSKKDKSSKSNQFDGNCYRWGHAYHTGIRKCVRVYTDKGSFDLSEDHKVILSSGELVPAGELKEGLSIASAKVSYDIFGYLTTAERGRFNRCHTMVAEMAFDANCKGMIVHHKDDNRCNNAISNLEICTIVEHNAAHNKLEHLWKSQESMGHEARQKVASIAGKRSGEVKMLGIGYELINNGFDISSEDRFKEAYLRVKQEGNAHADRTIRKRLNAFGSWDNYVDALAKNNHRVVRVEHIGEQDCYDVSIECDEPDDGRRFTKHNFVILPNEQTDAYIGDGIVVKNCEAFSGYGDDYTYMWNSWGKPSKGKMRFEYVEKIWKSSYFDHFVIIDVERTDIKPNWSL